MYDDEDCGKCICTTCLWQKTDECFEEEDYCEEICIGYYPTKECTFYESKEE